MSKLVSHSEGANRVFRPLTFTITLESLVEVKAWHKCLGGTVTGSLGVAIDELYAVLGSRINE